MNKVEGILWGVVFILIGLVIGGNATSLIDVDIFFVIGVITNKDKLGNVIGILIGVVLLLCCQGILNFEMVWKLAVPAILVIIGISIIFKNVIFDKISKEIKSVSGNKSNGGYCATFSGQDVSFDGEKFNGTDLTAVFGGIKCDLRNAIIESDTIVNTTSVFGGIEIYIPENVKVKIKSTSIFGGVGEKKKNKEDIEKAHVIYVNSTCIFGGVDIK